MNEKRTTPVKQRRKTKRVLSFDLRPRHGLGREGLVTVSPTGAFCDITVTSENGDSHAISGLSKTDALQMIDALHAVFDIPDHHKQEAALLQMQLDKAEEHAEHMVMAAIANIMHENGIRSATLTPSMVVSGLTPAMDIDATRPDQVTYTLKEEPLNVKNTTDDGSAAH